MMQTKFPRLYACLAQLVEQLPCKHQVGNSSFSAGTILVEEVDLGFILSMIINGDAKKQIFWQNIYLSTDFVVDGEGFA